MEKIVLGSTGIHATRSGFGALPVQRLSTSENPFDWNVIFAAPDGTTRLWWKVSKATLGAAAPAAPQCFAAAPESIMPLV